MSGAFICMWSLYVCVWECIVVLFEFLCMCLRCRVEFIYQSILCNFYNHYLKKKNFFIQ